MRTLIVEDDVVAQTLLAELLRAYSDVEVLQTATGAMERVEDALQHGEHYDLICLDIGLADEDGRDVLARLRELEEAAGRWPSSYATKVVMTTGRKAGKDIIEAFRMNCDGYLVKPIVADKLRGELERLNLA